MRASFVLIALMIGGCSGNNLGNTGGDGSAPDLAMSGIDMAVSGDLAGGPAMCDPIAQNCPAGSKCAIVGGMMGGKICVPTGGTNAEGQPCMRGMNGSDDCAAGLQCTTRGSSATMPFCRTLCKADSGCPGGQKCTLASRTITDVGICVPACTPFGTDCGGGLTCASITAALGSTMQNPKEVFICHATGTSPVFGACMRSADCDVNLICDGQSQTCLPICDDAHACPIPPGDGGTLSCMPAATTLANNPGVCQ